jgi:hypothetical protein
MGSTRRTKSHKSTDCYAGLIFICFGVLALLLARSLPMGTAMRMGPGYFPTMLGAMLALLGLIVSARGLWLGKGAIQPWFLRPLLLVFGAVLAFAFLIDTFGLLAATLALITLSSLGGQERRLWETALLSLMLMVLAVGLFVYGLGLPFKVWPV